MHGWPSSLIIFYLEEQTKLAGRYRGKGDYFRLGHGTDTHVRKPQLVEGLKGKKIIHVAVGALHCLAVTDTGQVRLIFGVGVMHCALR